MIVRAIVAGGSEQRTISGSLRDHRARRGLSAPRYPKGERRSRTPSVMCCVRRGDSEIPGTAGTKGPVLAQGLQVQSFAFQASSFEQVSPMLLNPRKRCEGCGLDWFVAIAGCWCRVVAGCSRGTRLRFRRLSAARPTHRLLSRWSFSPCPSAAFRKTGSYEAPNGHPYIVGRLLT